MSQAPVLTFSSVITDGSTVLGSVTTTVAGPVQIVQSDAFRGTIVDGMSILRPGPTA